MLQKLKNKLINTNRTEKNIFQLYREYIQWVVYKVTLKKKYDKIFKQSTFLENKLKLEGEKLGKLKGKEKKDNEKDIMFYGMKQSMTKLHIFMIKTFPFLYKFDGWILYGNKADNFTLIKVKNLKLLYTIKKEMYNVIKKIGSYRGKPLFVIKYPHALTLTVDDDGDLYYNCEAYYKYIDMAVTSKLTDVPNEKGNIAEVIRKNIIVIIVLIAVAVFIFSPAGQSFINGIISK